MKNALLIFLLLFITGCYKVPAGPPPAGVPTYVIGVDSYDSLSDPTFYFKLNDSTSYDLPFTFKITSGNAANYNFTCSLDSLPAGISVFPDSFVFRLNYDLTFRFTALPGAPIGNYTIYLKVREDNAGTKSYPFMLKVLPY